MKRLLLITAGFAFCASLLSLLIAAPVSLAQRPTPTSVPPTPTNTPPLPTPTATAGGSGVISSGGSKSEPYVPPQEGTVWGYVIDYSNGGTPQSDVPVVLDGGGWQAETVSDSNGYYIFAGLGSGSAKANLKLPPNTHPVNPNWEVHTGTANPIPTNLGYYWGDTPPMPVLLSVEPNTATIGAGQAITFKISVNNRSGGDANNVLIDFALPLALVADRADIITGSVDFASHRIWGQVETLPTDQTTTLTVYATATDTLGDEMLTVDAKLTYQEQLTPQRITVNLQSDPAETTPAADDTTTTATEVQPPAESTPETLIPDTGSSSSFAPGTIPLVIISLLFIVGLGFAGARAFARR